MAAYWWTLTYQSLFEPSRFFDRQEDARAFNRGFAAEFPGSLRSEDFACGLAEGANEKCSRSWPSSPTKMRPLLADPPSGPAADGEAA
jgi:hypothetical protein